MQKTIRAGSAPPSRSYETASPLPPTPPTTKATKSLMPKGMPPSIPMRKNKGAPRKTSKKTYRREFLAENCSLAMSRTESVLVSASGDVMVCRCRRSSTPYLNSLQRGTQPNKSDCTTTIGVSDFISTIDIPWSNHLTDGRAPAGDASVYSGVSTYEWEKTPGDKHLMGKKNISKTEPVRMSMDAPERGTSSPKESGVELLLSNLPAHHSNLSDAVGIISMPSFDYSHIHAGNNDMIPPRLRLTKSPSVPTIQESPFEEKKEEYEGTKPDLQPFFHGVPVFLSSLSQIRITKVSANPLGAHVLLISAEALLLTYGLNNHGQLGIGTKSDLRDGTRGFITSPTLVTPLLENGGKTINCAAGVNHSLVVVSTEGRRLQKLKKNTDETYSDVGVVPLKRMTSSPSKFHEKQYDDDESLDASDESVQHHQAYGFGRNDFMKVGLVSASLTGSTDMAHAEEDILLPHRVALHCTVWPQDKSSPGSSLPPQGIFDIAASTEHSAALVRRPTGDVEVYMWGNASLGALGKFSANGEKVVVKGGIAETPVSNVSNIYPHPTLIEGLSYKNKEWKLGFPKSLTLGPYCSFVLMSSGRCMSFGYSAEGMLGQGFGMKHTSEPKEVFIPQENGSEETNAIVAMSAGACHVLCITEDGSTWSWGVDKDGRLGLCIDEFRNLGKISHGKHKCAVEWVPQRVDVKRHASRTCNAAPHDSTACVKVCAGYDSSLLVMRSGQVLSFGKKSGRLGKGEVDSDVVDPQPLHGGLCLFHKEEDEAGCAVGGVEIPKRNGIIRVHSDLQ
jgi:alpha-tubulin suppressor-like RCC1 family protein